MNLSINLNIILFLLKRHLCKITRNKICENLSRTVKIYSTRMFSEFVKIYFILFYFFSKFFELIL